MRQVLLRHYYTPIRPSVRLLVWVLLWVGASARAAEVYVDVTARAGVDFVHFNGMSGELYFPEMMGAGAALFDYDQDGDLDLYLVQGNLLGESKKPADALFPPRGTLPLSDRLYRNEGDLRFVDVTEAAGIRATGYGMGVAVADVDDDGWLDLYVTNFGANQLWRNRGDGRFEEIAGPAGVADPGWGVSASFLDADRDGDLDLYVGNYVHFSFANHKPCRSTSSARDYCSPKVYRPQPDRLYRNLGQGRFEDVSEAAGIQRTFGAALGVVVADFNGDGRPDIYVANDGAANQLWMNQGGFRFIDEALLAGAAFNMDGAPEASMGVDAADVDGDGDVDLFITHLARETNTLYRNDGQGWFEDVTVGAGLGVASFPYTGFGTRFVDVDNDGDLDIIAVNGAVTRIEALAARGVRHPLGQKNQLFLQDGTGVFQPFPAGAAFEALTVSRGAAFGDLDNDGDLDLVINNNAGPVQILENRGAAGNHWIGIRPVGGAGAQVTVRARGRVWQRWVRRDGSYASSSDARVVVGLGKDAAAVETTIRWPDGRRESWPALAVDRYYDLRRGQGRAVP